MRKFFYQFLILLVFFASCSEEKTTLFVLKQAKHTGIQFNNRITETDSVNILTEEYIFNGGGVAVGDFNNDGLPDLFFTGNQVSNGLHLNEGGLKFTDVSKKAAIEAKDRWSTGVTVVDINGDDKLDVYVCAAMSSDQTKRGNMLFVNQGVDKDGIPKFKEMAETYGIASTGNSMAATFFDYDKDGLLDLYVLNNEQVHSSPANYRKKIRDGSAKSNDRLYHNNGDGTFMDVTLNAGITLEGFGLGIAIADLNYDGWPDIYVSNDYLTNDLLYINNTDGTFSNSIRTYMKHQSKFSMGSDIADFNNDGFLDIITLDMLGETNYRMKTTISDTNYINYVLNDRWDYEHQYMRNMLHLGNGQGIPSSEIGLMAGVARTDWSWSPLFVDVDNDGYRDLLITNGFPRDITDRDFGDFRLGVSQFLSPNKILDSIPTAKTPNYAYRNTGNLTFEDVGDDWGLNMPSFSNGAIFADLDKDGDLDYVVNNINDEVFVFENTLSNTTKITNFLRIDLKGSEHNPMGIGAKLVLRYGGGTFQYHEHHLTRGYMSSVDPIVHFGLGNKGDIAMLEVLWPDGKYQKIQELKSNGTLIVSYKDAKHGNVSELGFPLVPQKILPKFSEVSEQLGINYIHKEKDIVDYNVQRVLPHKLTQNGPALVVGDMNGDGLEDFMVGSSSGFSPVVFFQQSEGNFEEKLFFTKEEDKNYEEEGMALFDLDNDGDLDLYLVSGSNEFEADSKWHTDRLFVNDGVGNFSPANDKMPIINASGSVVSVQDFDNDGFVDLFVGGRTPFAQYPYPEKSFLLRNNAGKLEEVTSELVPDLTKVGMVTDAVWADIDADGYSDLIVVGELMPITVFKNTGTVFKRLHATGLENYLGWWEHIIAEDFDNDGDKDFMVGNMGSNNLYQPSKERPVTLLAKDFDSNGSIDPIMFAFFKDENDGYSSFPVSFWGDLNKQSPLFRSKFSLFKEYAVATETDLFNKEELVGVKSLVGNYDKSSYVENLGDGKFKLTPLPPEAQLAPINSMVVTDYNEDDNLDVLLVGNDYGNETFVGRYDAFNGLLLVGNDKTEFESVKAIESGFSVPEDAKSIVKLMSVHERPLYIVAQNRGGILVYQMKE